jgi:hypothetical protein
LDLYRNKIHADPYPFECKKTSENHEKVLKNLRTESESQKYVKAACATFPLKWVC